METRIPFEGVYSEVSDLSHLGLQGLLKDSKKYQIFCLEVILLDISLDTCAGRDELVYLLRI